jgi:pimeloyl-ACP methyl ester carboxylesterase
LDLLRYLRTVFEEPVVLEGEGVGGLVAALTAAAEPTAVAGLSLLPVPAVDPRGWSERPELVVSSLSQLNHGWVHAARRWSDVLHDPSANDPVLSAGPPCSLRAEAVREALRNLTAPWWCPEPHFAAALLPASLRIDQPPSALDLGRKQT